MLLSRKEQEPERRDLLVILSDNQTADIATVYGGTEDAIRAVSPERDYNVPIADLKYFVGHTGMVYVLGANEQYIQETRRLAALEKSTVLRQVTHFTEIEKAEAKKISIREIAGYVVVFVLLLAVIFK